MDFRALDKLTYEKGDLVIVRGRALSLGDNAFSIGVVLSSRGKYITKEYDDLWNTKELIWEKMYKILTHGKIINVSYYDIKGKAV